MCRLNVSGSMSQVTLTLTKPLPVDAEERRRVIAALELALGQLTVVGGQSFMVKSLTHSK
jgi:hypothetical protein